MYTRRNTVVCYALLVTYGVSGALEKRELEVELELEYLGASLCDTIGSLILTKSPDLMSGGLT